MATYEEYMNAARNADAAGDESAARQLVQAAQKLRAEPQQEVSTTMDVAKSLGSGAVRGAIAIPETVEMAGRGLLRLGQEGLQALGYEKALGMDITEDLPVLDTATGRVLRGLTTADDYQPQTTAGKYAGTVGEFLPAIATGPAGVVRAAAKKQALKDPLKRTATLTGTATVAGLGSEAAGQAAEGTALEPVARVVGAFAAPMAASKIANKTIKRSIERPSLESLRDAKNVAYDAVDKSGVKFSTDEVGNLINRAKASVDDFNYVPDVDLQTKAALSTVGAQAGKELTIGQLDKLRQGLYKRYNKAPEEQGIRAIIDEIDDLIEAKDPANALMSAAREANKRYKKSELLDEAFTRAQRSAAASGSGGNVVNNYRRAVANILNSKRNSKYFLDEEKQVMEQFVKGNFSENTLRLIGKLSPSGNGLMQALNIGAVAYNPAMIGVTGAGIIAKSGAERSALRSVDMLKNMIATGAAPKKRKLITDREIRILLGLQAEGPEEQ